MDCDTETPGIPANAQHAEDIALPTDAAERKRVLNILAQRRYRRRRRERQATLESLVGLTRPIDRVDPPTSQQDEPQSSSDGSPNSNSTSSNAASNDDTNASSISSKQNSHNTVNPSTPLISTLAYWETVNDLEPFNENQDMSNTFQKPFWDPNTKFLALDDLLQTDEIINATFADDFHIAVPELDLLRAAYENASRINSSHLLFAGLTAQSVFQSTDCSNWILTLPENLMPTETQLAITHHPAIDILPWPAVRDRLIRVYNMPADFWPRHPSDGSESSLVRFIYDMEDGGIRVTGQDPAKESAWEIDQRFFENWWWALDQAIVANTNLKRMARGQRVLCAPSHAGV